MDSTQKNSLVSHFSHPHLLQHTTTPSTKNITCFGCNQTITHEQHYYVCKTCPFSLHNICYKTPLITNHPSHPSHDLFLLVIPSSSSPATKSTFNCMACKQHATGFCYHCAECNIFFHSICITLPLSLSIAQHPHKMKLEFSPPYDFFCDLCDKPSYKGWLYRCNMCEFDIHVDCADKNIGGAVRIDSAVSGWNKKLFSPLKKHSTINGKKTMMELGLQETELITSTHSVSLEILDGITPLRDKMTPLSDDTSPLTSSNQFSDSYFSIDLNKSYSTNHDRRGQVRKEVNNDYISQSAVSSNSGQGDEDTIGVVDYWLKNHSHKDKVNNAALFKGGSGSEDSSQKVLMKNPKERFAKWSAKDQTTSKAEAENNSHSGWRKLLSCCL
ncbi:uncharacterized protein LOC131621505 [Vicia villosa]|uniref:uncharacterized protein LOC131621505 n=1 Tax=Vicia villosa TaxID=3911 RepID=UPI00273C483C|nr:uncharacterized protein LOC131621505 [Vicia villosa]